MARIDQFNAASSEGVLSQMPSKATGEVFNLLQGHTPILPGTLGTAQGSNGIDTPEGTTLDNLSERVNPHGVLVRNTDQYTTDAPSFDSNGQIQQGEVGSLSVPLSVKQEWVGNNVFGKPVYGDPEVQITNFNTTRDDLAMPTNNNPTRTTTMVPNVGSRLYRA